MFTNDDKELSELQLVGLQLAYGEKIEVTDHFIVRRDLEEVDRVTVLAMGEMGDSASLATLVADGLADVAVFGDYKAAPGPSDVLQAIAAADKGHGVLLLAGCAHGDVLTYNIALQQAQQKGVQVAGVMVHDNANTDRSQWEAREGLAALNLTACIAMAAASQGMDLEAVRHVSARFANNTATLTYGDASTDIWQMAKGVKQLVRDLAVAPEQEADERFLLSVSAMGNVSVREQQALLAVATVAVKDMEGNDAKVVLHHIGQSVDVPGRQMKGMQLSLTRLDDELIALWSKL